MRSTLTRSLDLIKGRGAPDKVLVDRGYTFLERDRLRLQRLKDVLVLGSFQVGLSLRRLTVGPSLSVLRKLGVAKD